MDFRNTLDYINEVSDSLDVVDIMNNCMMKNTVKKEEGRYSLYSTLKDRDDFGNPRKTVPSYLCKAIHKLIKKKKHKNKIKWNPCDRAKVPHTWFFCYVYDIIPDIKKEKWKHFECSHRCIDKDGCLVRKHLVWELRKDNQSRGNDFCSKKCKHKDCESKNICHCQGFHIPHCI